MILPSPPDGPVSPVVLLQDLAQGDHRGDHRTPVLAVGVGLELRLMDWPWPEIGTGTATSSSTAPVREPEVVATVEGDKPGNRFNDGKADSKGRIWIGKHYHKVNSKLTQNKNNNFFSTVHSVVLFEIITN